MQLPFPFLDRETQAQATQRLADGRAPGCPESTAHRAHSGRAHRGGGVHPEHTQMRLRPSRPGSGTEQACLGPRCCVDRGTLGPVSSAHHARALGFGTGLLCSPGWPRGTKAGPATPSPGECEKECPRLPFALGLLRVGLRFPSSPFAVRTVWAEPALAPPTGVQLACPTGPS